MLCYGKLKIKNESCRPKNLPTASRISRDKSLFRLTDEATHHERPEFVQILKKHTWGSFFRFFKLIKNSIKFAKITARTRCASKLSFDRRTTCFNWTSG